MPLSLNAVPQNAGVMVLARQPLRIAFLISSTVSSSPAKNFSMSASSCSAALSTIFWRHSFAFSTYSSGMSFSMTVLPRLFMSK